MKTRYLLATILVTSLLLNACGSGNGGGDSPPLVSAEFDYLTYDETEITEITKTAQVPLITDFSEVDSGIDIDPEACNPANGLCENWLTKPQPTAVPGSYYIGVGQQNHKVKAGYGFNLLPAIPAPAATEIDIHAGFSTIITTEGEVWAFGDRESLPSQGNHRVTKYVNLPFRTGITNASKVFFATYPLGKPGFHVLHRDGITRHYGFNEDGAIIQNEHVYTLKHASGDPIMNVRDIIDEGNQFGSGFDILLDSGLIYQTGKRETRHEVAYPAYTSFNNSTASEENFNGIPEISQVASHDSRTSFLALYLARDGSVWQKGRREFYDDENPSNDFDRFYPKQTPFNNMIQVATGVSSWVGRPDGYDINDGEYGVALRNDNTVWAWVPYTDMALPEAAPHQINGLTNIVEIAVYKNNILARDTSGRVWQVDVQSVGHNIFNYSSSPVMVPGITGASAIAVGENHGLAILNDCNGAGTVRSWALKNYFTNEDDFDSDVYFNDYVFPVRLGDGVRLKPNLPRPAHAPTPVIGIGDADASCPRKVLFYKSGITRGSDVQVNSDTGNMICDDYLCWESVAANTTLAINITENLPTDSVQPVWDCDAAGNSTGNTFSLSVTDKDVYCKLKAVSDLVDLSVSISGKGFVTSTPSGIDCPADCTESYPRKSQIQLQAQAASGWSFNRWIGSDCDSNGLVDLDTSNKACTAEFVPVAGGPQPTLTLTISGGPGAGQVDSLEIPIPTMQCINSNETETTCVAQYQQDANVTLFAQAFGTNNTITWTGCSQSAGDTYVGNNCQLTMDQDRTVNVVFSEVQAPQMMTLNLNVSGGGRLVTSDGIMDCSGGNNGVCSASYVQGSTVIIQQMANGGEVLQRWSGDDFCGNAGSSASLFLTLDSDKTCGAAFTGHQAGESRLCTRVLNETGSANAGNVQRSISGRPDTNTSPNIDCQFYAGNTTVTLTPQADPGFAFLRWDGFNCYVNMNRTADYNQLVSNIDLPPDTTCTAVFRNDVNRLGVSFTGGASLGQGQVQSVRPDGTGSFVFSGNHLCRENCDEPVVSSTSSGNDIWLRVIPDNPQQLIGWVGCDEVLPDPDIGPFLCRVRFTQSVGERRDVTVNFTGLVP